jgi:rubrerythrin
LSLDVNPEIDALESLAAPPSQRVNLFPVDWDVDVEGINKIFQRAKTDQWQIEDLPWASYDMASYSPDERVALAYEMGRWRILENLGPALFARMLLRVSERHESGLATKFMLTSLIADEGRHEELFTRLSQRALPLMTADPSALSPTAKAARRALGWLEWNLGRLYDGYEVAFRREPLPVATFSFLLGERVGVAVFAKRAETSTNPLLRDAFRALARDEARHLAFMRVLFRSLGPLWQDPKLAEAGTRQIRAGFEFTSVIAGWRPGIMRPWTFPAGYWEVDASLSGLAKAAGLGSLDDDQRHGAMRDSMVDVRAMSQEYGVPFPAIPELGLDGVPVSLSGNAVGLSAL